MAEIKSQSDLTISIVLKLNESEARALKELPSYGTDHFLAAFYGQLGEYALKPHEAGLRSLFETIKSELPQHLRKIDTARKVLKDESAPKKPNNS